MAAVVVGFAGHSRSGKTSIARAVSNHTRVPLASFGREVERVAHEQQLPLVPEDVRRATLMTVGERLVSEDLEPFCVRVLKQGNWTVGRSLLLEGVRHASVVQTVERLVEPVAFHLVLVSAPLDVRRNRLAKDGVIGQEITKALYEHSTEREASGALQSLAELVVDGTGEVDDAARAVIQMMHLWGWNADNAGE